MSYARGDVPADPNARSAQLGSIERLRILWHDETSSAAKRAGWASIVVGLVLAALVGRAGFDWSRAAATAIIIVSLVPTIFRGMAVRRRGRDPRAVMNATILQTDPRLARAALRALDLSHDTESDPRRGSSTLAHLHFARLLGRASLVDVAARAGRSAWQATGVALVFGTVALGLVISDPFRVLEGIDVLAARDGVAPVAIVWTDLPRVHAEPPAYLDMSRAPLRPYHPTSVHVGTSVTVNAFARRDGRHLVLTDGESEVPFHNDGDGALVARWTVMDDVSLRVAARFGDVLVPEPLPLDLHAVPDHAPFVRLEDAPTTIRLLDRPNIAIHWEATDDHGLREVALVLRAGNREERRELSKLQGGSAIDRGGIELRATDPFLEKSYLPIEVTVQALDNDPVTGPKWGVSAPIIVVPPEIGEREAMRYLALERGRDALTDLLAARLDVEPPSAAERADTITRERKNHREAVEVLSEALREDYGGVALRGRIAALVRGQVERMQKSVDAMATGDIATRYQALVERSENSLLALDSALGFLGTRDTRRSAIKLSEVAADAARAISETRDTRVSDRAKRRLMADLDVLAGSAEHLLIMGRLGRDLGEIVQNDLRRIDRSWKAGDRYHARLAAEDLAARLRNPDPSFGSAGGQGHGGGVESGGSGQQSEGDPSQAAEQAAGVDEGLEKLRQEHAQEMRDVEQALHDAMPEEDRDQLQEQLRQTAKEIREAVERLPQQASTSGSARADAAAARSEAESAALAMERGDLEEAVKRGQDAVETMLNAQKKGSEAPEGSSDQDAGKAAGDARQKMQGLMEEAKRKLEEMQRKASENARKQLEEAAKREKRLAERARDIRRESQSGEAPLPREMLERLREAADAMEDASRSLDQGRGPTGLDKQRQAQRLLEMSQPEQEQESTPEQSGDGKDFARDADVPPEQRDASADAFRKRVTKGLGRKAPPHLREALRRYTEGLLR